MKKGRTKRAVLAAISILTLVFGLLWGLWPNHSSTLSVFAENDGVYLHAYSSKNQTTGEDWIIVELVAKKDYINPLIGEYTYLLSWSDNCQWVYSSSPCGMNMSADGMSGSPTVVQVSNWDGDGHKSVSVKAGTVLDQHIFTTKAPQFKCGDHFEFSIAVRQACGADPEMPWSQGFDEQLSWSSGTVLTTSYDVNHEWKWNDSISSGSTYVGFDNWVEKGGGYESATANFICNRCKTKQAVAGCPVTIAKTDPKPGVAGNTRYTTSISAGNIYDGQYHEGYRDVTIPALPNETTITVTKVWQDGSNQDGIRPGSVTVGVTGGGVNKTTEITGSGNEWSTTITVPIVDGNGRQITYTAYEVNTSSGYQSSVNGLVITNTHTPEKTSVTVTKTWDDKDNQDGIRPGAVTIHLLGNGAEVTSAQLNDANGWAASFGDLPKYSGGNPISYTVTEDPVPGYTTEVSGFNIVNRHTPEKTTVTVTKTWDDGGNQDGKRPESITVHLLANGSEVQTATLNEAGGWAHTFADLPKFAAGKEIAYTVTEDAVEGYQTEIKGTEIVNTYTPETTEFTVTKVWEDEDDADGLRPASVTIHLLADGTETDQATLDETGGWTHTFADLPKYKDGKEIVYTVTEDEVTGYETEIKDGTVTNRHTLETETESESESESETESKKETESPSETETPSAPGSDPGSSGGKSGGLFHKGAAWALINLIAMIGTVVTALGMIATVFAGRKGERVKREEEETDEEYEERKREAEKDSPSVGLKFLGLIPAIFSVIVFLLTEDMRQPMRLTDVYTILMIVVFLVGLLLAFFTRRKNRRQKKEKSLEADEV